MPVVAAAAAGAVVAPPAMAPITKATTTTRQCPRNMPGRSSRTGASRSPPMAQATSLTQASSSRTTRASTATTAPLRASKKAIVTAKATTPTPTPTALPGVAAARTTATRANSVSWHPVPQKLSTAPPLAEGLKGSWQSTPGLAPGCFLLVAFSERQV